MSQLTGRCVMVTGAAGGLGTALCARLRAEGARVIAVDRDEEKGAALCENIGEGIHFVAFDQSKSDAVPGLVSRLERDHGPIDSLVNNAAIYPKDLAVDLPPERLREVLDVNVVASAAYVRAIAPAMAERGFGRIVNVASITFDLGFEELSAYVASKAALVGLARSWARELGASGITANAVSPGAFQTDAEKIHPDPEGYNRFVLDQQAVKRRGTPEDFAHLVAFLLDERTGFLTGQNIRIDGGWVTQ